MQLAIDLLDTRWSQAELKSCNLKCSILRRKKNWGLESGSLCKIFNIFIIIPSLLEKRKKYKIQERNAYNCSLHIKYIAIHFATSIHNNRKTATEFFPHSEKEKEEEEENSIKREMHFFEGGYKIHSLSGFNFRECILRFRRRRYITLSAMHVKYMSGWGTHCVRFIF